jgi:type IV pilus assembly protein PilQ
MNTIFFMISLFLSDVYSSEIINDVQWKDNSIVITHSAERMKYSIKNLQGLSGIEISISDMNFKVLREQPVVSDIVKRIKTFQYADVAKIEVETLKAVSYDVVENKGKLIIKLYPSKTGEINNNMKIISPKKEVIKNKGNTAYVEKKNIMERLPKYRIDIDYSEADVREVLTQLAARASINVVFSNDVTGNISLSLKSTPFDEVFKTVLDIRGLVAQQIADNVLKISTTQSLFDEQKNSYLQTKVIFLNYVKASDLKAQIESVAQAEGRVSSKCNVDDTNNALIVTDTPMGLETTEMLVKKLDRIPKQVLIEAKLVEVNLNSGLDTGIQWSVSGNKNGNYVGANSAQSDGAIGTNAQWGNQKSITPGYSGSYTGVGANLTAQTGGTGVELPASTIYGAFRFGRITSNFMFDAIISAAEQKGNAKVLSNPKIATLNNKTATILITDQTPYDQQTATISNGQTTISHNYSNVDTGITLEVTPTITSDGQITMHVVPEVKQLSGQPNGIAPPPTATRKSDTNVIVQDGETIVIGGLIHDYEQEYEYKVPLLGDIPLLGYLFKKTSKERQRMELLIFVTPKIIES